ncbi:unnamed protein product, partial [Oppiella nova]
MSEELAIGFVDLDVGIVSVVGNRRKQLLRRLSGGFEFGTISALMGSSGSGKTTLLKCLNGSTRYTLGPKTQIYVNSCHKIRSCFIYQDQNERLLKGLTVRQALTYACRLKNSDVKSGCPVSHRSRVRELMDELLIGDIGSTRVDECSGGELKRLVIAMELTSVLLPNVMFIDEPTTGLDSNAADVVISCLKTLSRKHNIAIITSIHQPNNEVFMHFDNVYVLARHGVNIYWGRPQHLSDHLRECGITCGTGPDNEIQFPIEVLLKYSSKPINDSHVKRLSDKSRELRDNLLNKCTGDDMHLTQGFQRNGSKRFNFKDFWYLLLRTSLYTFLCQWKGLFSQILFYILFLLCLTFAYNRNIGKIDGCFNAGSYMYMDYTCDEIVEEMGILEQNLYHQYIASVSVYTIHTAISTSNFLHEMKIFTTEHQNRWYGTGSYYWAKAIVEQILSVIYAYIYTII